MTAREIKDINREISRLRAKMARIQAEADNTAVTLGDRIVPSGQTSDRVDLKDKIATSGVETVNSEIFANPVISVSRKTSDICPLSILRISINWFTSRRIAFGCRT